MSGIRQIFGKELARIFRDKKNDLFRIPVAGDHHDRYFVDH